MVPRLIFAFFFEAKILVKADKNYWFNQALVILSY